MSLLAMQTSSKHEIFPANTYKSTSSFTFWFPALSVELTLLLNIRTLINVGQLDNFQAQLSRDGKYFITFDPRVSSTGVDRTNK